MADLAPGDDLRLFDADPYRDAARLLRERFIVPPFTVLDAGQGYWQARKRNWLSLGIEAELGGRDTGGSYGWVHAGRDDEVSRKMRAVVPGGMGAGVSLFDPVLCELAYRWWSPAGGTVLDPFAGGSVRGVVAHMLGRYYVGVELRPEQVEANYVQSARLRGVYPQPAEPVWQVGDSTVNLPDIRADFIFTCPPFGDLEVYSDDPRDLSAMTAEAFDAAYRVIIRESVRRLRPDRFAAIIVGNYRDRRTTFQRDLAAMTVRAFSDAGCGYYSDLVLITSAATAGMRGSATFNGGRKPIRRHQYVLVFVKGDWRHAAEAAEALPDRGVG